jgi:PKHD-type hydroxylase
MLLQIPQLLTAAEVADARQLLEKAQWVDGKVTAGYQSAQAKNNLQVPENDPIARQLGALIGDRLRKDPTFLAGALPRKIFPPLFNCYQSNQSFGVHVDNAIRYWQGSDFPEAVRTDLSATLFLSDPQDYDGGELVIEDTYGTQQVKLPAGSMVLYPGTSLHRVNAVSRGTRIASFFWIQSMVRDDGQRAILFDLDQAIQRLTQSVPEHPSLVALVGVYHNLLRQWAEV